MPTKIRLRRRVTSGNIPNPELQQQRVNDLDMRRQVVWSVTLVVVGVIAFLAITIAV